MSRIRLSTTIDKDLLGQVQSRRSGVPAGRLVDEAFLALLQQDREAEIDASYNAYDARPLSEPDQWGDLESFRTSAGAS